MNWYTLIMEKTVKARISFHQIITWIAILGLLILRLVFDGCIRHKMPSAAAWIDPLYEIGTYGLVIFLIIWEREDLKTYHLNPLAVLLLILFPFISKLILRFYNPAHTLAFPKLWSFAFLILAAALIYFYIKKKPISKSGFSRDIAWFAACAIFGLLFSTLESLLMIKFLGFPKGSNPGLLTLTFPLYQLGYAAALEEPLFRGFLWGALRKLRINEVWVLLIQALIFAGGHFFYLNSEHGLLYIAMIFVGALIMGLLVWRTRSLSSSMAFHAFTNGSAFFLYWFEWLILK